MADFGGVWRGETVITHIYTSVYIYIFQKVKKKSRTKQIKLNDVLH